MFSNKKREEQKKFRIEFIVVYFISPLYSLLLLDVKLDLNFPMDYKF